MALGGKLSDGERAKAHRLARPAARLADRDCAPGASCSSRRTAWKKSKPKALRNSRAATEPAGRAARRQRPTAAPRCASQQRLFAGPRRPFLDVPFPLLCPRDQLA